MRTPTPKQKKLINGLIANAVDPKKTKTLKAVMIDAGYKEKSTKNPHILINSPTVQLATQKVIKRMEMVRDQALIIAAKKAANAPYNHLIDGADKMQKNIQLLAGKSTNNVDIHVTISEAIAQKNQ